MLPLDDEQTAAVHAFRQRPPFLDVTTTAGEADGGEARRRRRDVQPSRNAPAVPIEQHVGPLAQHFAMLPFLDRGVQTVLRRRVAFDFRDIFLGVIGERSVDAARHPMVRHAEADDEVME